MDPKVLCRLNETVLRMHLTVKQMQDAWGRMMLDRLTLLKIPSENVSRGAL